MLGLENPGSHTWSYVIFNNNGQLSTHFYFQNKKILIMQMTRHLHPKFQPLGGG
jgi:hypothetical protein